ncbi:uncharacterized protein FIBRA_02961 [Fibroporia radiculosa]|uniref:INO80 complex subunit B-like conserved region domain-containing protein n=1 Tax=Fibroporia radiculosa TaxID=599839 RepID=J4GN78_9APHY|nr:uncharacterized protein FIBRA_02961 [Fibroporia radiculosa]CCM00915.1 predicted protein [Fibroporia radiculosa]
MGRSTAKRRLRILRSDVDQIHDDMDVDEEDPQQDEDLEVSLDEAADDRDVEIEEEELPDDTSQLDASPAPEEQEMKPVQQPRLKIKLKLPAHGGSTAAQTERSTPDETGASSSRRGTSRDYDVESEDEDEPEDDDDDDADGAQSTRSTSVATTGTAGKALTARQAVLANVVDSSHVSLGLAVLFDSGEQPNSRRKKPLTQDEIALKREETARKRKNLSEKKLEDEKTETINRLLKKQSRAKGRRNALSTAEDRPSHAASTANGADVEGEDGQAVVVSVIPTTYRWKSTSRSADDDQNGGEKKMALSFSVPVGVLQSLEAQNAAAVHMAADQRHLRPQPQCDVLGCTARRKYRLVKDWERGACDMSHLKLLEAQSA